jgi:ribosomal protein S18 acetylase RimI-like enzyme
MTPEQAFRHWYGPWKERVCEESWPFSHGIVFRSRRLPDYWEYNCLRLEKPVRADQMVAFADRELADCAHRLVEWMTPMPDEVVSDLRGLGWMVTPLIFMLHAGDASRVELPELVEVDYDQVRELRDIWHREDFGEHTEAEEFHAQAREAAELADVQVVAMIRDGRPIGFAQVETHDGGSEVAQVFVHPDFRGQGLGAALTAQATHIAGRSAPNVWICAERDDRPRRLYARLGFRPVVETGVAIRLPRA